VARVPYVPLAVEEGDGQVVREALAERVIGTLEEHAPGFASLVVAHRVITPGDLQRRFGLTGGCLYHADMALDQLLYLRPLAGWSGYRMPISNLYLCGSGTHPGGGISGQPGRNAALQILGDWKQGRVR
ncbi:MAG: phytoene desaturase family protein, partial [Acidobacteriota bacterium]